MRYARTLLTLSAPLTAIGAMGIALLREKQARTKTDQLIAQLREQAQAYHRESMALHQKNHEQGQEILQLEARAGSLSKCLRDATAAWKRLEKTHDEAGRALFADGISAIDIRAYGLDYVSEDILEAAKWDPTKENLQKAWYQALGMDERGVAKTKRYVLISEVERKAAAKKRKDDVTEAQGA